MISVHELFRAGKLDEAVQALTVEVRENPTDTRRRTFLFELLCFTGDYGRAEKQLDVLAQEGPNSELGALLYHSAIQAERIRQDLFSRKQYPKPLEGTDGGSESLSGTLNGRPFQTIEDADPRIGQHLEVFAGGDYLWINFGDLASLEMEPPQRVRDLLWAPARVNVGPRLKNTQLGEVLLPVLSPAAWQSTDDEVRLGRVTEWVEEESKEIVPMGQKMLLIDGEEFPLLEVRKLELTSPKKAP